MGSEGLDPAHRVFVSYIDRTREYYTAQGYTRPYRWATNGEVPFAPLPKPLAACTVAALTTAFPYHERPPEDGVLRGGKEVWSGSTAELPERLYTDDLSWDKEATHMNDVDSFLPVRRLAELVESGRICRLAPRFHGVPTDYSQRRTVEQDAPEILRRCREDGVDVVVAAPI